MTQSVKEMPDKDCNEWIISTEKDHFRCDCGKHHTVVRTSYNWPVEIRDARPQEALDVEAQWIKHIGGGKTLSDDCPVRVEFTDGEIQSGVAKNFRWSSPYPDFPVVKRYQILGETPTNRLNTPIPESRKAALLNAIFVDAMDSIRWLLNHAEHSPKKHIGGLMDCFRVKDNHTTKTSEALEELWKNRAEISACLTPKEAENDDLTIAYMKGREDGRSEKADQGKALALRSMETAPKDGTVILIRFEHMNYQYADADDKDEWWELCEAKWIDHNGGGWTWHGIAGEATGWLPKPKQHYTAQPPAYDVNGELLGALKRCVRYIDDLDDAGYGSKNDNPCYIDATAAIASAEAALKPAYERIKNQEENNG